MSLKQVLKAIVLVVAIVAGLLIALGRWFFVEEEEYYSKRRVSYSAAEAKDRGVLVRALSVESPLLHWKGREVRVREAWIEEASRVRYRFYVSRQLEKLGRYRLAFTLAAASDSTFRTVINDIQDSHAEIRPDDTTACCGTSTTGLRRVYWEEIQQPSPSSLRVIICNPSQRPLDVGILPGTESVPVCPGVAARASPVKTKSACWDVRAELTDVDRARVAASYPPVTVDRLAIRQLLRGGSYSTLDSLLDAYARLVAGDFRHEWDLLEAYEAVRLLDPSLESRLNEWIAQRSRSAPARLARAAYFMEYAWEARGSGWAKNTKTSQFEEMKRYVQRARADIDSALQLDPRSMIAYDLLMEQARTQGDQAASWRYLEQALQVFPYSFALRVQHMLVLLPRWGGSYLEMDRFASEAQTLADRNPRLRLLCGFQLWDFGRVDESKDDTTDAIRQYTRALLYGDYPRFLVERGELYASMDRYREAVADFDRALAQRPQLVDALYWRGTSYYYLGEQAAGAERASYWNRALADVTLAARLDPADQQVGEWLRFLRETVGR